MRNRRLQSMMLTVGLAALGTWCTAARADSWDKLTTLNFNQPVEVPGHVLVPGHYVFKLANLQADRDVVQVFSEDRHGMDHLVTTAFAVPDYRLAVSSKPVVTFEERLSNSPEAIHSWFYPGEHDGWDFVYPPTQGLQASASVTPPSPVAPAPAAQPAPTTKSAAAAVSRPTPQPAAAAAPAPQPVEVAQNHPPAAPEPAKPAPAPTKLPKTASDLPMMESLGVLMLALGGGGLGYGLCRTQG
ncbi:MAG: hypothetical protein LAP40_27930 [Acidobacteriia bacterium]|nr:hypothetical protein [Terriglobia bacterium]